MEADRFISKTTFWSYGQPLASVSACKYLVRILVDKYKYWSEAVANLRKAQNKWAQVSRILGRKGADVRMSHTFFNVVFQAVLLFGS